MSPFNAEKTQLPTSGGGAGGTLHAPAPRDSASFTRGIFNFSLLGDKGSAMNRLHPEGNIKGIPTTPNVKKFLALITGPNLTECFPEISLEPRRL